MLPGKSLYQTEGERSPWEKSLTSHCSISFHLSSQLGRLVCKNAMLGAAATTLWHEGELGQGRGNTKNLVSLRDHLPPRQGFFK